MGFLDSILGKSRLPEAKTERLFAISTAAVTLQANLGLQPSGAAALCMKPEEFSGYEDAKREIEELLKISVLETKSEYDLVKDELGYLWLVFKDPDFDDLVTLVHMAAETLIEKGYGTRLLAAVYPFQGDKKVYWIFNFKQGAYYPFVPAGDRQRDTALEFRLKSVMERELPIEKAVERWYPMWGMPL